MAFEKTAFNIKVTFTDSSSVDHEFCAAAKTIPGYKLGDKLDTTTDCSGPIKEFLPADQYEITDMTLTAPIDLCEIEAMRLLISDYGTLKLESTYTGVVVTFANVWLASITPGEMTLDSMGTYDMVFEFGGGTAGIPTLTGCP